MGGRRSHDSARCVYGALNFCYIRQHMKKTRISRDYRSQSTRLTQSSLLRRRTHRARTIHSQKPPPIAQTRKARDASTTRASLLTTPAPPPEPRTLPHTQLTPGLHLFYSPPSLLSGNLAPAREHTSARSSGRTWRSSEQAGAHSEGLSRFTLASRDGTSPLSPLGGAHPQNQTVSHVEPHGVSCSRPTSRWVAVGGAPTCRRIAARRRPRPARQAPPAAR